MGQKMIILGNVQKVIKLYIKQQNFEKKNIIKIIKRDRKG